MSQGQVRVSLLIPTLNGGALFKEVLESIKSQSLQPVEFIVVDSSSSDGTAEAARAAGASVTSVAREGFDHGGTRAEAARRTTGEVLVFMTQDALLSSREALAALVAPLSRDKNIGAAYGRQLPSAVASAFAAHLRQFNYPEVSRTLTLADRDRLGLRAAFLSNTFAAYRREALEGVGWFRDNLIMGEDTVAAASLLLKGHSVAYVAEAAVYHSHNYSVGDELRRYFDIGVLHKRESWLLKEFGAAGGEGLRYVRSELRCLLMQGRVDLLPAFVLRNLCKYAGYKCGLRYELMPRGLVLRMSLHRGWWGKEV